MQNVSNWPRNISKYFHTGSSIADQDIVIDFHLLPFPGC